MNFGRLRNNAIRIKNDCIKIKHIFTFNLSRYHLPPGRGTVSKRAQLIHSCDRSPLVVVPAFHSETAMAPPNAKNRVMLSHDENSISPGGPSTQGKLGGILARHTRRHCRCATLVWSTTARH